MTDQPHPDADRWRELAPSDPGSDPSRDFWGDAADWRPERATDQTDDDTALGDAAVPGLGAAARRWWNSTGRSATRTHAGATRSHFAPTGERITPRPSASDDAALEVEASAPWLDDDDTADEGVSGAWDDGWQQPVDRPRGGVDPLLARFGGVAVVLTLLVPVAMSFTSDSDSNDALRTADAPSALAIPATEVASDPTADALTAPDTAAPLTAASNTDTSAGAGTAASASAATEPAAALEPAVTEPASTEPAVTEPASTATASPKSESLAETRCGAEYEIVAGDFWIRLADGAGVDIADLFAVNDATSDTPLYPGRTICLPIGARTPPPPATTPATTQAPATTPAPSGASSSGSRSTATKPTATTPRSTIAPTTTVAPPASSNATADQVQAIVRAVWPDELEERALEIAWRESNFRATAKNNCCYGVFQIYWSVHRSWLGDLGITSPEQLYDPTLNARAALTLYQRAGGWGPWGG